MSWELPIYDRTIEDVEFAKNNQENLESFKGALNVSDLNRIENNTVYLYNILIEQGYTVSITEYSGWKMEDIFYPTDIDRIRQNVINLVDSYSKLESTPTIELGNYYLGIIDINDIENVLYDVNLLLESMIASFRHCGSAISGQGGLIL